MCDQHAFSKLDPHRCGCCASLDRRDFMSTVGLSALAAGSGIMGMASAVAAETPKPAAKPRVRAVFLRPDVKQYWMGWPGASYDIKARQVDYTKRMTEAADKLGVDLQVTQKPIPDLPGMNAFMEECAKTRPDGVILTSMCLNSSWPNINHFVAKRPPELPTVVISPMGTSFTGHLQATRNKPKTLVMATQDLSCFGEAVHLLKVIQDMKCTRLCIVNGSKTEDQTLKTIGTTLHHVPLERWVEELNKCPASGEVKALAARFTKTAKKVVEPKPQDVINAAKTYFVAKKIMADEKCQGISLNCLGLIGARRIPCPPCMAWQTLNDEGGVGACECDWNAAISMRLCALLCGRPGFQQDPCPNTVANTLMGAHCTSASKLEGFDKPALPVILRSHSESGWGVSPQVLFPVGEPVTVMKFNGPDAIILGTGKVVANIDTPPAGGCRTSVELAMDNVADSRDCKGFHQLFILGNVASRFKAYCELAGIQVVPV